MTSRASRLFTAVPIPPEHKQALREWQQSAKPKLSFHKWVYLQDLHVTLQFLGDTAAELRSSLEERLLRAAQDRPAFRLRIRGLGVFGPAAMPQILWAGIEGGMEPLRSLHQAVEAATEPLGFEREKRAYKPHLTLARRYRGSSPFDRKSLSSGELPPFPDFEWTVNEFVLYESRLGREPMYEPVSVFRFT